LRSRWAFQGSSQVGVSGFKIDLGIRHPDHPERFSRGRRVRWCRLPFEQERARSRSPSGRGASRARLGDPASWSTDWFDNPGLETEKLSKRLEELRLRPRGTFDDYCLVREVTWSKDEPAAEPPISFTDDPAVATPTTEGRPFIITPRPSLPSASEMSLPAGVSPLTEEQAFEVLRELRDTVIKEEMTAWEPHRSILRDSMIETFVRQRITDPEDWFRKVPQYQRSATNPVEKRLFLSVSAKSSNGSPIATLSR